MHRSTIALAAANASTCRRVGSALRLGACARAGGRRNRSTETKPVVPARVSAGWLNRLSQRTYAFDDTAGKKKKVELLMVGLSGISEAGVVADEENSGAQPPQSSMVAWYWHTSLRPCSHCACHLAGLWSVAWPSSIAVSAELVKQPDLVAGKDSGRR